jgi:uncharacterized small protein (DUF1192 family)
MKDWQLLMVDRIATLTAERDRLAAEVERLTAERDTLAGHLDALCALVFGEPTDTHNDLHALQPAIERVIAERDAARRERDAATAELTALRRVAEAAEYLSLRYYYRELDDALEEWRRVRGE